MRSILLLVMPVLLLNQNAAGQKSVEEIQKMHQDPQAYIAMLENPQREEEQKPREVLAALGLKKGEALVDIGAGSGYFTFRFAPQVGNTGRVYAVDINPDMIMYMNRQIRDRKLNNVVTVLSAPDDPLLPATAIDRFFICNTWHHVQNRPKYIQIMKQILKPGGQIIVLDYHKKQLPVGPPPEMKMAREEVIAEMEAGGLKLAREHTFLPYQFFLVFASR